MFDQPKKQSEWKSIISMVLIAVLLMSGLLHVITWNTRSIDVVWIQGKTLIGFASAEDYKHMASICFERRMYSCAEKELGAAASILKTDTSTWANLGELQFRRGKYVAAIASLETYQSLGGQDEDALYALARAYMEEKQSDKAIRTLTHLMSKKTKTLQVTVTRSYVEALMQASKWEKAKNVIEKTRGQSASFNMFMNAEYRAVLAKTGKNLASR